MTSEGRFRQAGLWAAVALVSLVGGTVGGLVVFWINGASTNPVVGWFGDFLKSPGFSGLCAVIAAGIAIIGISLQIQANRQREADAVWWESFEWASDRGLPRDSSSLKLPADAAIDTLNALATAARTDIQKHAVRGVVEELVRTRPRDALSPVPADSQPDSPTTRERVAEADSENSHRGEADASPGGGARADREAGRSPADDRDADGEVDHASGGAADADENGDPSDGDALALWRYVIDQMGTAAESRRAAEAGYVDEVFRALRHQYDKVVRTPGSQPGDLTVEIGGRSLIVAIQWAPGVARGSLHRQRLRGVDVVISNARAESVPPGLEQVVWEPRHGSYALRRALEAVG